MHLCLDNYHYYYHFYCYCNYVVELLILRLDVGEVSITISTGTISDIMGLSSASHNLLAVCVPAYVPQSHSPVAEKWQTDMVA